MPKKHKKAKQFQEDNRTMVAQLPMSASAQKIRDLGLEDMIVTLLAAGVSLPKIVEKLNEELLSDYHWAQSKKLNSNLKKINRYNVNSWIEEMSEEMRKIILDSRDTLLRTQAQDFINQSFRIREEVIDQLTALTEEELERGTKTILIRNNRGEVLGTEEVRFSPGDRKDLANILMQKIKIQESTEKLLGIDSGRGANPTKKEDDNDVVLDRMKEQIKKRKAKKKQDTVIDVHYEDVDNTST